MVREGTLTIPKVNFPMLIGNLHANYQMELAVGRDLNLLLVGILRDLKSGDMSVSDYTVSDDAVTITAPEPTNRARRRRASNGHEPASTIPTEPMPKANAKRN